MLASLSPTHLKIAGLCLFIGFLSFKPSEPYLSQYLICNAKTAIEKCSSLTTQDSCLSANIGTLREDGYGAGSCSWTLDVANSATNCVPKSCSSYPIVASSSSPIKCADVNYCTSDKDSNTCVDEKCYKNFSETEVNNYIYPWSTYAYLPALMFFCPLAELVSYRMTIIVGIAGRVVTRFLLLFATSLQAMQLMQVTYSIGTAAEDIFYAYVFYAVPTDMFQTAMSTCRSSALVACLVASILGDLLVTQAGTPLTILQIISCVFVCFGAVLGFVVIQPSEKTRQFVECGGVPLAVAGSDDLKGLPRAKDIALGSVVLAPNSLEPSSFRTDDDDTTRPSQLSEGQMTERKPSAREVWYQKSKVFLAQWAFFSATLRRDPNLQNQVLYWIIANATYTEIFGYEVAVYQQLNGGNNKWNGSVLSVMLLLGAVGAMLPVFLKVDSPGMYSTHAINAIVVVAGILGSVFLLVFAYVWKAVASLAMLSLFVACWQFISVIILVQVATELKMHHDRTHGASSAPANRDVEVNNDRDSLSLSKGLSSSSLGVAVEAPESTAEPPSYAIAIVSLVGVSVILQNLTITIVFSGLQLSLQQALMCPCYLFAIATFVFAVSSLFRRVHC